jgi:hypothetical protein
MKRRNAILLGLAFLLVLAGYVAWCWRPFYSPPSIRYEPNVPKEAIVQVERWRLTKWKSSGPMPFSWKNAYYLLKDPYIRESLRKRATYNPDFRAVYIKTAQSDHPWACFIMESGTWRGYDTQGKPLPINPMP